MNNFWTRTITGLSMVFLLLAAMALNYWFLATLFFIVVVLGLWEFYSIFTDTSICPQRLFGTIAGGLLYTLIVIVFRITIPDIAIDRVLIPICIAVPFMFLTFVFEIYRKQQQPVINVAITITGILYISVPLALLNLMNGQDSIRLWQFPVILAGFFLITWIYDTGAYLYGKRFGRHKFFERISPRKTWEGTIAGAFVALATSVGLSYLIPGIGMVDWCAIAILIIIFGTFGDLVESLFKRSMNIKDSGSILPGHGGILDRFDTVFISVPFVFLYLVFRNLI